MRITGKATLRCVKDGKVLWEQEIHNASTVTGRNKMLDVMFKDAAKHANWYIGLIDDTPTLNDADTMASHAGWDEFEDYDESTREAWVADASASDGELGTGTNAEFTVNDDGVIGGIFITSDNEKGAAAGTLWATAAFSTPQTVTNGSVIQINYSVALDNE